MVLFEVFSGCVFAGRVTALEKMKLFLLFLVLKSTDLKKLTETSVSRHSEVCERHTHPHSQHPDTAKDKLILQVVMTVGVQPASSVQSTLTRTQDETTLSQVAVAIIVSHT